MQEKEDEGVIEPGEFTDVNVRKSDHSLETLENCGKAFSEFKREGIRKYNQCRITESHDDMIGERLYAGQKGMRSFCSGFFKKEYY